MATELPGNDFAHRRITSWRSAGEFIPASDALFIVAAIAAVFAAGLIITESLTREPAATSVAAGGGREVSLGDFRFGLSQLFQPAAQNLYEQRLKSHSARISQAVEEAGRAATDDDLDDPELANFRNRIQGKVNGVLGARAVEGVLIDDFRTMTP